MSQSETLINPQDVAYEQLFEGLNDPCVLFQMVDGSPIIVSVNTPFEDLFIDDDDTTVTGMNLNELIVPKKQFEQAKKLDRRTEQGEINGVEVKRKTRYGIRQFLYRGIPLNDGVGFGIYIDITQRTREREYIDVLQRVLRHNLRNDISVVKGFAKRLDEQIENDELSEYSGKVVEKASQIEMLTEEASTIRDIINEEFEPDTEPISVNDVVCEAIGSCIPDFDSANVGIECTDGLSVRAGQYLQVAFEALIDNGLRYNDSDQPTVMICGHKTDDNRVHISITDNGVGISPTERKIVTGDKQRSPLEHGSGLGLWVSKWIIESYQGTIDIHRRPTGKGTVVEFWLNC